MTPEEAIQQLDMTEIAYRLSQLALKAISGKDILETEYLVSLVIPAEIAEIFEQIAEITDVPVETLLSGLAKEGFNKAIGAKIAQHQQQPKEDISDIGQQVGLDMKKFQTGMQKIQDISNILHNLQKDLDHASIEQSKKDNK